MSQQKNAGWGCLGWLGIYLVIGIYELFTGQSEDSYDPHEEHAKNSSTDDLLLFIHKVFPDLQSKVLMESKDMDAYARELLRRGYNADGTKIPFESAVDESTDGFFYRLRKYRYEKLQKEYEPSEDVIETIRGLMNIPQQTSEEVIALKKALADEKELRDELKLKKFKNGISDFLSLLSLPDPDVDKKIKERDIPSPFQHYILPTLYSGVDKYFFKWIQKDAYHQDLYFTPIDFKDVTTPLQHLLVSETQELVKFRYHLIDGIIYPDSLISRYNGCLGKIVAVSYDAIGRINIGFPVNTAIVNITDFNKIKQQTAIKKTKTEYSSSIRTGLVSVIAPFSIVMSIDYSPEAIKTLEQFKYNWDHYAEYLEEEEFREKVEKQKERMRVKAVAMKELREELKEELRKEMKL